MNTKKLIATTKAIFAVDKGLFAMEESNQEALIDRAKCTRTARRDEYSSEIERLSAPAPMVSAST